MIANNRLGFYWTVLLLRAVTKERVAVEGPCFDLQQTELVRSIWVLRLLLWLPCPWSSVPLLPYS